MKNLKEIPKVIAKIDSKIEKLENASGVEKFTIDKEIKTNYGSVQLKDVNNLASLVSIHANLKRDSKEYTESVEDLGLDLKWSLHQKSFEEWEKAIKWRVHKLSIEDEIKKLKETKSVLEKNMEEEDKKKREIENALKDINLD